ncbi:hypothetical protein L208DRAFT_1377098 [Tricholoma matsutake]|nr:hypothetical protein L208DRAFT_1377098 [Tricholoma matsutake 945]
MAENISNETVECTLGALLLGNLAAAILYGVTCIQAYIYYRKNYKDTPAFRFLASQRPPLSFHLTRIVLLSGFELYKHIGCCVPHLLITNGLIRMHAEFPSSASYCRLIFLVVSSDDECGCAIASGLTFTTGFAYATRAFAPFYSQISILTDISCDFQQIYSRNFQTLVAYIGWSSPNSPALLYLVYAWFGSGLAADIMIAASLSISLFRSRTGFAKTESMIRVIIMYAINTCLLITVSFAACFIAYVAWPGCLSYVGLFYSLSPPTLNSRGYVSERFGDVTVELENCSPVVVGQSGLESELKSTFEAARNFWTAKQ